MKAFLLLVISSLIQSTVILACKVEIDGEDKTSEFFVRDEVTDEMYVDCMDHSKCRDAVITDCPIIKCFDNEACNSAKIINFTDRVICEGLHACHRTEMPAADSATDVSCIGSGSCDVAQITGNLEQVSCRGVKACRKVNVIGSKLVKCHQGHERTLACEGFATLETECLYCGKNGCADHINMCRYKIIGEETENDKYLKCHPDTLIGNCPADLKTELRLELEGKDEIDIESENGTRGLRASRLRKSA